MSLERHSTIQNWNTFGFRAPAVFLIWFVSVTEAEEEDEEEDEEGEVVDEGDAEVVDEGDATQSEAANDDDSEGEEQVQLNLQHL